MQNFCSMCAIPCRAGTGWFTYHFSYHIFNLTLVKQREFKRENSFGPTDLRETVQSVNYNRDLRTKTSTGPKRLARLINRRSLLDVNDERYKRTANQNKRSGDPLQRLAVMKIVI